MNLVQHPFALLLVLFLLFGLATSLINFFTVRRFDQYPLSKRMPFVSVLVPARNEERNIEACVTSLLAQDYPDFEVIVLDDNSNDATSGILARLLRQDARLKVLHGTPLPDGWLGKHWACRQLDQAARGELILFTDADTRHAPDMLKSSVSALFAEHTDLVTAFPYEEVVSWGERLLVPVIGWGIHTFIPIRLVQKLRWPALSITIGQFMLFRRSAYDAVGGFEAVRSEVVDDMCLGRNIIKAGLEWRLLNGTRHVTCRMYHNFWESVNGFSKSLFAVFDYRILPYLIAWALVGITFIGPVMTLTSYLFSLPMFLPIPVNYAAAAMVLSVAVWSIAFRRFHFPAYLVLFYPFSLALFIAVGARSFLQTATGTTSWKDRVLDRVAMRWL